MKNNLLKQLETLGQSIWLDICLYREQKKIDGPLFPGMDTHALSVPGIAPKPKPKENQHK